MRRLFGILVLPVLAALAAGCGAMNPINAPYSGATSGGSADLARYVAMGTSITAGTQSNGLVVTHQQKSFAYLFSQQIGATSWSIPSVSAPGLPALLHIKGVTPLGGVIINNTGIPNGVETNRTLATAFSNMGVPFAVLPDAATLPGVSDTNAYYTPRFSGDQRPLAFDIVCRHRGSILAQVASQSPTFVTFEYGSNEILGAATTGRGSPLVPVANWSAILNATLNALQSVAPTAKLALLTVPDPTSIPYMTTFKPYTLTTAGTLTTLIGTSGPLSPGDLVTLGASDSLAVGTGFPTNAVSYLSGLPGNGRPLPDNMVLTVAETQSLRAGVDAYNSSIRAEAAARGAAVADLNGLLKTVGASGYRFQTQTLTTAFVTGGLFSLDGVHPTDVGHGLICNLLIDAVNVQFGANLSHVDLSTVASASSSSAQPVFGEPGAMPWLEGGDRLSAGWVPWR
jgi:hypothetical protein